MTIHNVDQPQRFRDIMEGMEPSKLSKKCLAVLLQVLNFVAFVIAMTGGIIGGGLGLWAVASYVGIASNPGILMIGFGLGGLAGFFIWALPQLPKRTP